MPLRGCRGNCREARHKEIAMKHYRMVTRTPRVATIDIGSGLTGSTPLEIKVNFTVMMVDRAITYVFQKSTVF